MTTRHYPPTTILRNAVVFLRRVVAYGVEQDELIRTVDALEREITRREKK